MQIGKPEITSRNGKTYYTSSVRTGESTRDLWFCVDDEYSSMLTNSAAPAILALLIPAMKSGEDLHVNGMVCPKLLWHLNNELQDLFRVAMPHLRKIAVHALAYANGGTRATGVSMGFSGGIDSFATLARHLSPRTPEGLRITHLVFHDVGQHGDSPQLAEARFSQLLPVASELGLPFIEVQSNVRSFYDGVARWRMTHSIRDAASAYLLQNEIGTFLYSSGYSYENLQIREGSVAAYYDAVSLPLLESDSFKVISAGANLNRTEKTLLVSQFPPSYRLLNVCVQPPSSGRNCSRCEKCLRTMLSLDIAGALNEYSSQFDFVIFRRYRSRYLAEVLVSKNIFKAEIRNFAAARGFSYPISAYLLVPMTWSALNQIPPFSWIDDLANGLRQRTKRLRNRWRRSVRRLAATAPITKPG